MGKEDPAKTTPRRLLVRLRSEETATELLHSACQLRESADNYVAGNIYINRDLSPTEAKLAYQKRVKRRESLVCQNLRSAASNTPDCELMPSVNTTAVGLNDHADIVHETVSDSNTVNQSHTQSFL